MHNFKILFFNIIALIFGVVELSDINNFCQIVFAICGIISFILAIRLKVLSIKKLKNK